MSGRTHAPALRAWAFSALALLSALLAGCTPEKQTVYATPDYTSWEKTTDVVLDYPIPGHQDQFRIPRMNGVGFSAKPAEAHGKRHWDFPPGTIIVKEVYHSQKPAPGERPIQLTIMVKAAKDPRSQGGWMWLTRSLPDGAETVFKGNYCITCHDNANEKHPYGDGNPKEEFRDYVYFVPGEEAPGEAEEYGTKEKTGY